MTGPGILASTPPYGFTQYTDADGDFLTFGTVEDVTERQVYGIVAAIATPNPDGIGLTAEQARDLARGLVEASGASGVEYGVLMPDGEVKVYGDQDWVRSGQAVIDAHPDGKVVCRTVTRLEGSWRKMPGR